jgi:hypothetical protein
LFRSQQKLQGLTIHERDLFRNILAFRGTKRILSLRPLHRLDGGSPSVQHPVNPDRDPSLRRCAGVQSQLPRRRLPRIRAYSRLAGTPQTLDSGNEFILSRQYSVQPTPHGRMWRERIKY